MPVATFLRFTVPPPAAPSAGNLRYVTRPSAVRDGRDGLLLVNLPAEVARPSGDSDRSPSSGFDALRAGLVAWAAVRERAERDRAVETGRVASGCRTHYRAVLGFERDVPTADALRLAGEWLREVLPRARAVAALHRDTARPHVHVWVEARQTDGRKVDLSARQFRQLDEAWNRLYCRALGLPDREHLARKWDTERAKALWRGERAGRERNGTQSERDDERRGENPLPSSLSPRSLHSLQSGGEVERSREARHAERAGRSGGTGRWERSGRDGLDPGGTRGDERRADGGAAGPAGALPAAGAGERRPGVPVPRAAAPASRSRESAERMRAGPAPDATPPGRITAAPARMALSPPRSPGTDREPEVTRDAPDGTSPSGFPPERPAAGQDDRDATRRDTGRGMDWER